MYLDKNIVSAAESLINLAFDEDLPDGDITTRVTECGDRHAVSKIIAKEDLVWCAADLPSQVLELYSHRFDTNQAKIIEIAKDGKVAKKGEILFLASGSLSTLLSTERIILNFCQRLSGIATHVRNITSQFPGLKLLDTRKTLPGYRLLEKYAVKIGGGYNHRFSLSDQVLIKDNHIAGSGKSAAELVLLAKKNSPDEMIIEVEVDSFEELAAVVASSPDIILLDNMNDELLVKCLEFIRRHAKHIQVEISGNINRDRLNALSDLQDCLFSMGQLTYGARSVDLSMEIEVLG